MKSGIYIIRNTSNNKIYVGSAVNITKRFLRHRQDLVLGNHSNTYLQRAWDKYGKEAFTFKVHLLCDRDELITNEQIVIDTSIKGLGRSYVYNICETAGSSLGRKPTLGTRKKMSEARKGKKLSQEAKMKVSRARKGKKLSVEHRLKLSESHKGYKQPQETKSKISEANKRFYLNHPHHMIGKKHTEETKRKMRETHRLRMGMGLVV